MRYVRHFVLSIFIILIFLSTAIGATYYIDADNGNNSWDGRYPDHSQGASHGPKATGGFTYGFGFQPGDSILFKRGTINMYQGQVTITAGGSPGNPIIFGAYGTGANPILTDGVIRTGWTSLGGGTYSLNIGSGPVGNVTEDVGTTGGSLPHSPDNTLATGNWFFDGGAKILYYKPTSGVPTDHLVMTHGGVACYPYRNTSWLIFQDLTFIGNNGIYTFNKTWRVHNIVIQRCTFTDCVQGLYFFAKPGYINQNITIDNCLFQYNLNNVYFARGINYTATNNNIWVINSKFLHTTETRYGGDWLWRNSDTDGISCQNIVDSIIEHNEITGICNLSAGINCWFDRSAPGTGNIIRYNYIHDITQGAGINWGGSDNGVCNAQIYCNIIVNCAGCPAAGALGGISLQRAQTSLTPTKVYNNVIYSCNVGIFYNNLAAYFDVKNNIVYNSVKYQVRMNSNNSQITSNNNCYYPITGSIIYYNGHPRTYHSWTSLTGQDYYSITSDPVFVNAASGDYRLNANSPCKTAGSGVGLTYDYFGNKFKSSPSMGAIQYYQE